MYVVLFLGLLLAWLFPDSWLLAMPVPLRAIVAVVIAFLPIFAANVVFAWSSAAMRSGVVSELRRTTTASVAVLIFGASVWTRRSRASGVGGGGGRGRVPTI